MLAMAATFQPLLQKQQYPFPPFQPLSEERLQEKGKSLVGSANDWV